MHHDAQKLTTRGFPKKAASEMFWPRFDRLGRENAGAGWPVRPTRGFELEGEELDSACQIAIDAITTTTRIPPTATRRLGPGIRNHRMMVGVVSFVDSGPPWSGIGSGV
jgi:hypothetical protein